MRGSSLRFVIHVSEMKMSSRTNLTQTTDNTQPRGEVKPINIFFRLTLGAIAREKVAYRFAGMPLELIECGGSDLRCAAQEQSLYIFQTQKCYFELGMLGKSGKGTRQATFLFFLPARNSGPE